VGVLSVTVDGFRSDTGHARVAVFKDARGFPDDGSAAMRRVVASIKDGKTQVRFDGLPFGDYAVSMFHDKNDDGKLNKKLFGIPKEGYGVSNNIVHATRAPKFTEALFHLDSELKELTIHVHY
jgi:uncharacterized protein (DUF2141 family)